MPLPEKKIKLEGLTDFKPGVGAGGRPKALQVIAQVRAALQAKYDALGGLAVFGEPLAQDVTSWTFKDAMLVHDPDRNQVFVVRGAIYERWLALGGLTGFGGPITDDPHLRRRGSVQPLRRRHPDDLLVTGHRRPRGRR